MVNRGNLHSQDSYCVSVYLIIPSHLNIPPKTMKSHDMNFVVGETVSAL